MTAAVIFYKTLIRAAVAIGGVAVITGFGAFYGVVAADRLLASVGLRITKS